MVLTAYFLFFVIIQTVLNGEEYSLLGSNDTQFEGMDHLHLQGQKQQQAELTQNSLS
jgi:hypothetical protein